MQKVPVYNDLDHFAQHTEHMKQQPTQLGQVRSIQTTLQHHSAISGLQHRFQDDDKSMSTLINIYAYKGKDYITYRPSTS